jgi:putative transposase
MRRFELSDEQWRRVESLLPGRPGSPGRSGENNRLFLDAVLWIVRTGTPWRDLPERFGDWNSIFQRFNRWAKKGVWQRVFDALQDPDLEWVMLDATIIRAHVHAAGARKKVEVSNSVGLAADSARRFMRPATDSATPSNFC